MSPNLTLPTLVSDYGLPISARKATMPFVQRGQPIDKEQLEQLYLHEHLSMQEIAGKMGCSVHKVSYWMDRHGIPRRSRDEATYVKRNPDGDPFEIKELETADDYELFNLGIGLYIGEGTKSAHQVRFANTDPQVIRTFLRFLRETCGVEERRLVAWLNLFDDADLEEARAYWEQVTGLPRTQFYKPTVRSSRGGNYLNKSRYGTLTIGINNSRLSAKISGWCKNALKKFG